MNRKQALIKKMAKRTKARENKKEHPNHGAKDRYISKAERAKLEAAEQSVAADTDANPAIDQDVQSYTADSLQPKSV